MIRGVEGQVFDGGIPRDHPAFRSRDTVVQDSQDRPGWIVDMGLAPEIDPVVPEARDVSSRCQGLRGGGELVNGMALPSPCQASKPREIASGSARSMRPSWPGFEMVRKASTDSSTSQGRSGTMLPSPWSRRRTTDLPGEERAILELKIGLEPVGFDQTRLESQRRRVRWRSRSFTIETAPLSNSSRIAFPLERHGAVRPSGNRQETQRSLLELYRRNRSRARGLPH